MKKFSYIILSLFLAFAPAYAYATTSIGGWTLVDAVVSGSNTIIKAAKTAGSGALKSSVNIAASATKVAAHLIKGGGQAALAYAVVELLGEGIDWVLDPANNAIKYKVPAAVNPEDEGYDPYRWTGWQGTHGNTANEACANFKWSMYGWVYSKAVVNGYTAECWGIDPNGALAFSHSVTLVGESLPYVDKYLPMSKVAAKVISNAAAGHPESQDAVKAVALEGFAAGEHDSALDAAATPDTAGGEGTDAGTGEGTGTGTGTGEGTGTDPNAPPVPPPAFELPAFCSWAAPVCAFATWAQQEWSEFVLTITALKDWLFEEPAPNDADNTIDPTPVPITPTQVAINFVGSCPAPLTFEYKIYNQTFKPAVPFTPMCEVAILINPVIKICASIAAIYIVAGIRQGSS